ncbi:hypothetical protein ACFSJS_15165 [Streptomyces desertarenae]|uniref:Tyr recombinase domain-containing protein n=1 Tax=Streptomyces desertarenae TaxID=2666184 RepID=A0ABW4PL33_9ACTN
MTLTDDRITAERLEELLGDDSVPLAHRALWLLLWECELKVLDLLSLETGDVDLAGRRVTGVSGRAVPADEGALSGRAVELLAGLIGARATGPLLAVGGRSLGWEEVVRTAEERGHGIHAFRTGGKLQRRADSPAAGE